MNSALHVDGFDISLVVFWTCLRVRYCCSWCSNSKFNDYKPGISGHFWGWWCRV